MKKHLLLSLIFMFTGCFNHIVGTVIFGPDAWQNLNHLADCIDEDGCEDLDGNSSKIENIEQSIIDGSCYNPGEPGADELMEQGMKACNGDEDDSYDEEAEKLLRDIRRKCNLQKNFKKPVCKRINKLFSSAQASDLESVNQSTESSF